MKLFQRLLLAPGLVLLLLSACAPASPTVSSDAIETAIARTQQSLISPTLAESPTQTLAPKPSNTFQPTFTTIPTKTNTPILPTRTPRPPNTRTPIPQPITLTGSGDSVVDLNKWPGAAILQITYTGSSNFSVINYDSGNNRIDLLVNTIGSYSGKILIDLRKNTKTARLEITASGPWEVIAYPFILDYIRLVTIPTTVTGTGDDVFVLKGTPDLLKVINAGKSNFIVHGFAPSGYDLLVNEIAPYTGTIILDPTTMMFTINATGDWEIEITTK
jgi:hypothetical protein